MVSARPVGGRCTGLIQIRWPTRPSVRAGHTVRLDGRWIASQGWGGRPEGIFVVKRVLEVSGRPALAARLRGWITETAEARFGARAPLVDALVLGRRGTMDPDLKDAFARSGLVHLLSISGFHVGLIAWLVVLPARSGTAGSLHGDRRHRLRRLRGVPGLASSGDPAAA
jgi:predicted membrane metal-binding protein